MKIFLTQNAPGNKFVPPVSTMQAVQHSKLRIFSSTVEKIKMALVELWGLRKDDSWKKPEVKNIDHGLLNIISKYKFSESYPNKIRNRQ